MTDNNNFTFPIRKGETPELKFCGYTCVGGRTEDQDTLAIDKVNGRTIFIVCDGMGGHAGGCVASMTAATTMMDSFQRQPEIVPTKEAIVAAVTEANSAVYKKAMEEPSLRGMGTTVTLLVFDNDAAYLTHIGDSRIYFLRNGKKVFRTFDDSMVFEKVARGQLTEEEARLHPRSNVLSKALGILPDIEVYVKKLDFKANDRAILCCDGVWNCMPEKDIIEMLSINKDPETTVLTTRDRVEKIGFENGGHHDNHTMIVVDLKNDSKFRESIFSKLLKKFKKKP